MNDKLKELYARRWSVIRKKLLSFNSENLSNEKHRATNPLLIRTNKDYEKAKLKIMFFGQETNTWGRVFGMSNVFDNKSKMKNILDGYESFYLNQGSKKYGRAFWNFVERLKNTKTNQKAEYLWNNVFKIGKCEIGTPPDDIINDTFEHFNVIQKEIEILKPDVLLFFSGPNYDEFIRQSVGAFRRSQIDDEFSEKELCKLDFRNGLPIKLALRSYHPEHLRFKNKKYKDRLFKKIEKILQTDPALNKKQKTKK